LRISRCDIEIILFGLGGKELDWVEVVTLSLFARLVMLLGSDDVRIEGVISLVLNDVFVIGWVHVSGLVAVVRVMRWVGSYINFSL